MLHQYLPGLSRNLFPFIRIRIRYMTLTRPPEAIVYVIINFSYLLISENYHIIKRHKLSTLT